MLLGIAVLTFTLGLGWTLLGSKRSDSALASVTSGGQPAAITYRDPSTGGGLIASSLALQSARLFSGRGDLALEGGLDQGGFGPSTYALYDLETPDGQQSYRVDARTAEVLELRRLDALAANGTQPQLDAVGAEVAAERFAADRFLGFASLTLVDRGQALGAAATPLYSFKWAALAPESGAELPTSVSVSVSAASGEVVWYLAQRDATTIDPRPRIEREAAVATAAQLASRAGRWDVQAPSSVRLQVVYGPDNRQQLVWAVTFPPQSGSAADGRPNLRILVDAQTGDPVSSPA